MSDWRKGEFEVATNDGMEKVDGAIHPTGLYGVRVCVEGEEDSLSIFNVTHIPTGYSMTGPFYFTGLANAKKLADWLVENFDMTDIKTVEEARAKFPESELEGLLNTYKPLAGLVKMNFVYLSVLER